MRLYGYFRSSASYRIRIALNLKGIHVDEAYVRLRRGEQRAPDYLALNPQGLVPTLIRDDGKPLTQSVAIMEWLEETYPDPPLLPVGAAARAQVRAFALAIACDIHPVQNLKVLQALKAGGFTQEQTDAWARSVNAEGLAACEGLIVDAPAPFCFGGAPTMADVCLIPQLANARRFGVDVGAFPKLLAAEAAAVALPAFRAARPELQPDAE